MESRTICNRVMCFRKFVRVVFCVSTVAATGCDRGEVSDQAWSRSTTVASSDGGLVSNFSVHKWNKTLLGILEHPGESGDNSGVLTCSFIKDDLNAWVERKYPGSWGPFRTWHPLVDPEGDRIVFFDIDKPNKSESASESTAVGCEFLLVSIDAGLQLRTLKTERLAFNRLELLGPKTISRAYYPATGPGAVQGAEWWLPVCVAGNTLAPSGGAMMGDHGVALFHSKDGGISWTRNHLFFYENGVPSVCLTESNLYYFGVKYREPVGLWYSRTGIDGDSWSPPKAMVGTYVTSNDQGNYVAKGVNDTVHLCWIDNRNERGRDYFLVSSKRRNFDVFYRNRRDSDNDWNREVLLSDGLLYSYRPSMSVEGRKIVVAWAGVKRQKFRTHGEHAPNDIYYTVSADNGYTWRPPTPVTVNLPTGLTAGRPQVVLHRDAIHLFYIQGKFEEQQVAPGLKKLGQAPWDILYQHRRFPD